MVTAGSGTNVSNDKGGELNENELAAIRLGQGYDQAFGELKRLGGGHISSLSLILMLRASSACLTTEYL